MPMPSVYNKFNRGEVGEDAVARDDVKKINNSASLMTNFVPQRLGPMAYRPGMIHQNPLPDDVYLVPFSKKIDDTAILVFSHLQLRVIVDGKVVRREATTTSVTNHIFASDLSGWTDDSGAGSSAAWTPDGASLTGTDSTSAVLYQTLVTDIGQEQGIQLTIDKAPARVRVGTSGVGSTEVFDLTLSPGNHSFVFTPDANITITLSNNTRYSALVQRVAFNAIATDMVLWTPFEKVLT